MPIPTLSVDVVSLTTVPSSVQPADVGEDPVMVTFLLDVSALKVILLPAANSRVSVFEPLENESLPTFMVLNIFWEEPRSVLVIVGVWLSLTEIPVPAIAP